MTDVARPIFTVIGGPNGSGKSTLTAMLRKQGFAVPIIDPDAIARELNPGAPEAAAIEAGREALARQAAHLASGMSFAIETTLAGNMALRHMEQARQRGFATELLFIAIEDVRTNIERVVGRVERGGHHVPDVDVRRRYARGMANLVPAIDRADRVTIFDNSTDQGLRVVLTIEEGNLVRHVRPSELPMWVATHLGTLLSSVRE